MRKIFLYIIFLILFAAPAKIFSQGGSSDYQYALIEAVKQKNLGNIPGAIELYHMVTEENDSAAIAYFELGSLYIYVNEPELAEKNMKRAYTLDPGNIWYINGYIDILVIREKYDEAKKLIEGLVASSDNEIEFFFKQANIYFMSGKSWKAIKILNEIEKKYGVSDKVILFKASIYEEEEKFRAARKEIEKLIAYFPESIRFLVVAADLAVKSKQKKLVKYYSTEVFEIDSTNIYALTNLTDYYREKKEHSKSLYFLEKSFESDIIEYEKKMEYLTLYLTNPFFIQNYKPQMWRLIQVVMKKHPLKYEIKLYAINFYIQQRNYKDALETLKPLLDSEKRDYGLWRQGILLANTLSDNEALLNLANRASSIFPDSSEIVYFRGIAEYENELYNEVVKTFNKEIISGHENKELVAQTNQILAESYHHLSLYQQSDSLFRILIKDNPNNYLILNNFSYYLSIRGESLVDAREMSYRTIIENPENGTFLDTYAWILYKMGDYKEAEKYINKALQKGGLNDPDVNEHAADIHWKLQSFHIARSFYEKAIILGGSKEKLEKKLKELEAMNEK